MRTKKKRKRILLYKCTYCGDESNYSLPKLITHLDINHKEITETDKKELIKNLNLEISRKNKPEKRELRRQKVKEQNKLKAENKAKELSEFKNKVLEALANSNIDEKKLEIIKSRKNIEKVKRILMFGLKKQFQIHLDNFGIDYKVQPKKRKRRRKKAEKKYFDKTENSIRVIYTPMGNKR